MASDTSTSPIRHGAALSDAVPELDIDALREKYRIERDRRIRPDGEGQYLVLEGELAHFNEHDPYAPADFTRAPVHDDIEVVIIGGGFSGLMAAARLREQGVEDVRIVEAGADFGGTWYWNRYPGAQCDIESYIYLPLLEETGYIPQEKYSFAPEIFGHSQRIGHQYGLYDIALFQTRVRELRWDATIRRWRISTSRGDDIRARFAIVATGPASRAKLAGIPGIDSFAGRSFHTSRWDYGYTGGDQAGGLTKLADKRVAVIGTGATAVQCVPRLAASAGQLYVFQRTPSAVGERGNMPTDAQWAQALRPGWQLRRRENFNAMTSGQAMPHEDEIEGDPWADIARRMRARAAMSTASQVDVETMMEIADFEKMNEIRARVDQQVADPITAAALKPWYRNFCKRPTYNDEYLAAFNRPNVTLVDVSGSRGVERITPTSIVADGIDYPVDCIVYATGFEIGTSIRRRLDFNIHGEGGRSLMEYWGAGMRTLHGHSSSGFPNWFFIGLGQNGISPNMTSAFDDQARHVAYIISEVRRRGAVTVQPSVAAETAWVAEIRRLSAHKPPFDSCTPGYYNNEGRPGDAVGSLFQEFYGASGNAFNDLLKQWRENGQLDGLDLAC